MVDNLMKQRIIDYMESNLSDAELREFEELLKTNPDFKSYVENYRLIMKLEEQISKDSYELHPNFTVKVMQSIEGQSASKLWRYFMELIQGKRITYGSLALVAMLAIGVKLYLSQPQGVLKEEIARGVKDDLAQKNIAQPQQQSAVVKQSVPKAETESAVQIDYNNYRLSTSKVLGSSNRPKSQAAKAPQELLSRRKAAGAYDSSVLGETGPTRPYSRVGRRYDAEYEFKAPVQANEFYLDYSENARILVADQAVSTFSIDVDTGSYTNARRFLTQGKLPPASAIRVEEFINYFDYDYVYQTDEDFKLSYEIAPAPLDPERYLLRLGVKAKDVPKTDQPWNLSFLIDVSGSMNTPDKLELVKRSLKILVNNMRPQDKVSLVTYAGRAAVVLEAAGYKDKAKILTAIDSLSAGGSTAGASGINLAYGVTEKHKVNKGVNRVILATDGDFNVGISSHKELLSLIENKRRSGISLTTIGVGTGNIREATMEQLANKGNGNYFYLDSFKEARKVFETQLAGNMETVARDVKLQIEFNPEHVFEYRLLGYENRKLKKQDFNNDKIDAGEIGSGHTVTALYEIVLADSALADKLRSESRYQKAKKPLDLKTGLSSEIAFLKLRYKTGDSNQSTIRKFPISKAAIKSAAASSQDFRFVSAVAYFGQLLKKSEYLGNYTIDDVIRLAESGIGSDSYGYRREFVELAKNARVLMK